MNPAEHRSDADPPRAVSGWVVLAIWQGVYPTIQAELFPAAVRVSGIGVAHQIVIAALGGTARSSPAPSSRRATPTG